MTALLRYLLLKTSRDRSLWVFLLAPLIMPAAALIGGSLAEQHALHYPFLMAASHSADDNANLVADISSALCALFAILPAFWTLRSEVASRSIGSFALATRPVLVVASVILLAATVVFAAWTLSMGTIVLLTTAWPAHLALRAAKIVFAALAGSAIGIAGVSLSVEAPMVIAAYACGFSLIFWLEKARSAWMYGAPLLATLVLAGVATFFLERRCAS